MLARVSRIMEQLVHAWDVLATMTPPEYSRSALPQQQQRLPELAVPLHRVHARQQERRDAASRTRTGRDLRAVEAAYRAPSLYDESLRLLARRGWRSGRTLERDWTQPTAERRGRAGLARGLPRPEQHWDLYQLGEELTDLEDAFPPLALSGHVTTVERVIGFKRGTAARAASANCANAGRGAFPEIWKLRTDL
jgi:tryptophan 2,3-dioxygenase